MKIDDIVFINMVEVLDGAIDEDQTFQALICEEDAIYGCEFGNWMAIRQLDDRIFFMPAFDKYYESKSLIEYDTPKYIEDRGLLPR